MLKKSLFTAAVFLAALVGPAPALAEPVATDGADCLFNGLTISLDPVPIVGGTGNFHFVGTGTCTLHGDVSDPAGKVSITIDSTGTYNNTVCGTGSVDGSATITGSSSELPATINYHIDFVKFTGALQITGGSHADGSGASGGGGVVITPSNPGGCVTGPATGFNVYGEFSATFNDA